MTRWAWCWTRGCFIEKRHHGPDDVWQGAAWHLLPVPLRYEGERNLARLWVLLLIYCVCSVFLFFIDISVFSFLRLCVHCLQLLLFYWRGSHAWLRVHMFRLSGAFVLVRCARVHPITIACLFTTNYQVKWVSYVTKCSVCCSSVYIFVMCHSFIFGVFCYVYFYFYVTTNT